MTSTSGGLSDSDKVTDRAGSESDENRTGEMEGVLRRIAERTDGMLTTIEESVKALQPGIDETLDRTTESLTKKLRSAGLGVFATKSINLVKEELSTAFGSGILVQPVLDTISECRSELVDLASKTTEGISRRLISTPQSLRVRMVQMHTRLSEQERLLEVAAAQVRKWRSRVFELENLLANQSASLQRSESELIAIRANVESLGRQLTDRSDTISGLKGELSHAQSIVEEQTATLSKLGSASELLADHSRLMEELAQLRGRITISDENLARNDETIRHLSSHVSRLEQTITEKESQLVALNGEVSAAKGASESARAESSGLRVEIGELKARWDMLFRVAEDEPVFKAYFLVAGKTSWFPLSHLSSALGIPTVRLKMQLQKFLDLGLLELDDDRIRARNISDVAREIAGHEEKLVQEMKSRVEKSGDSMLEAFDIDEPLFEGGQDGSRGDSNKS